ncbi:MAG: nitroreductase family protein [Candidatus Humimicrobiaceae bacterium]
MDVYRLIKKRRTIRKFKQEEIPEDILKKLVDAARLAPSAANLQPLEYVIVNDKKLVKQVFKYTKWAGYISPEGDPGPGEEPTSFIVVLVDLGVANKKYYKVDCGTAAENLIIAALSQGIGSCIIGACNKGEISRLLKVPKTREIEFLIALGYPAEKPVREDRDDTVKYYKDGDGVLHVPKKPLKKILHFNSYHE